MEKRELDLLSRLAKGIAKEFGSKCEVVVHDLESKDPNSTIVAIENGEVSGRKLGDGPSNVVLKALNSDPEQLHDKLAYLTKTEDGKVLRSSTIFYRNEAGKLERRRRLQWRRFQRRRKRRRRRRRLVKLAAFHVKCTALASQ